MSLKNRVEHANVFKAAIETLSIKTNITRRSAGLKSERERERDSAKSLRTVPCCETHRPEEWRETTMRRVCTERSHLSVHLVPIYIKKDYTCVDSNQVASWIFFKIIKKHFFTYNLHGRREIFFEKSRRRFTCCE